MGGSGRAVAGTSGHPTTVRSDPVVLYIVVRTAAMDPLEGVTVTVTSGERTLGTATTNAHGRAEVAALAGQQCEVRASYEGGSGDERTERAAFRNGHAQVTPNDALSYVTVFMQRPHHLRRPFLWQNEVIRRTIYRDDGENEDPGTPGSGSRRRRRGRQRQEELKDRKDRLIEACRYIREFLPSPPAPPGRETAELRHARSVEQQAAQRRDATAARLHRREERLHHVRQVELPEVRNRRTRTREEGAQRREDRDRLRTENRELIDECRALRRQLADEEAACQAAARETSAAEAAALAGLSHDEIIAYIVGPLFGADPSYTHLPRWFRYALIHYTGMRYAIAHRSYYPPQWLAFNLGSYRIEQAESGWSDEEKDHIVAEMRALLSSDARLRDQVGRHLGYFVKGHDRARSTPGDRRRHPRRPRHPERYDVGALLSAAAENSGSVPRGAHRPRYRGNTKGAAVSDLLKGVGFQLCDRLNTEEAQGLLKYQRALGVLRDQNDPWRAVIKHTHLRCDEVAEDNWQDAEYRRLDEPWYGIFGDFTQREWGSVNARTQALTVIRCECNEIAEIAAAARGVVIGGRGLRGDADSLDDPQPAESEQPEEPGAAVGEVAAGHRLFHITSADQLAPGDLIFHYGWSAIPSMRNADPGKCVTPGLDMEYQIEGGVLDPASLPMELEPSLHRGSGSPAVVTGPLSHRYARARCKEGRTTEMIVRRSNAQFGRYDEYLRFKHVFTVVRVHNDLVYSIETAAPLGMKRRGCQSLQNWEYVAVRPPTPGTQDLARVDQRLRFFLDRRRLLRSRR